MAKFSHVFSAGRRKTLAAVALAITAIATVGGEALSSSVLRLSAEAAVLVYFLSVLRGMGAKGLVFLSVSALVLGAVGVSSPDPWRNIDKILFGGCFVAAFFAVLGTLRFASQTSPMIRRCGLFLSRQKPGRRYLALTLGGHLFGMVLNYGSIALLGTMVEKSNAREKDEIVRRLRLQRMLVAVQRGFTTTLTWSPLALSMAVTLSILPETHWEAVLPFTLVTGFGLAFLGWFLDRLFKPTGRPSSLAGETVLGGWHLLLPVVGLVVLVFCLAYGVKHLADVRMAVAVMIVVPLIATAWLCIQFLGHGLGRAVMLSGRRINRHLRDAFPSYRNEIALLWSAAVIGGAGAVLVRQYLMDGNDIVSGVAGAAPWLVPILAAWLVALAGQGGMNPILSVTLLGGLLPDLEALGLSPVVMAVAITAGWSVTGASSPFTATTVLVGQIAKVSPPTVGIKWNGVYTLLGLTLISLYLGVLEWLL